MTDYIKCREGCGACCIVPSISSKIPGMPNGKPAGVRCLHLTDDYRCGIFNNPERPKVCDGFKAELLICGDKREFALQTLAEMENLDIKKFL